MPETTIIIIPKGPHASEHIPAGIDPLRWTAARLLLGAGAAADPTEVPLPVTPTMIIKTADEAVNNSIVLQADDELVFPVLANEVWVIDVFLRFTSPTATPDLDYNFAIPVAATLSSKNVYGDGAAVDGTTERTMNCGNAEYILLCTLLYIGGANAGNIILQWAQNTATVEDTLVREYSYLRGIRI